MDRSFDMFIETEVPENELIVSRTDFDGIITYVNETFANISGYDIDELIGRTHNIIRHPDMPKSAFEDMWKTIKNGETWEGFVKNIRKDRGYYWVYAQVSTVMKDGKAIGYKSIREPVSKEKKIEMQNLYDELRLKEENQSRVVLYIDSSKLDQAKDLEIVK